MISFHQLMRNLPPQQARSALKKQLSPLEPFLSLASAKWVLPDQGSDPTAPELSARVRERERENEVTVT